MTCRLSVLAGAGVIFALACATGNAADTKQAALAAKGKAVFDENCVACHQPDAVGLPGTAPSLRAKELLRYGSDRFFTQTITDGRPDTPMPSFADVLKPADIKAVIAYLRSLAKEPSQGNDIDKERPSAGDVALGKDRFAQICASCHGENGEGYEAEGSGTAIGKAGFLSKASDGFIRGTIREGRSNTPMHGFIGASALANLSYQEIDAIVAYLRSRQGQ